MYLSKSVTIPGTHSYFGTSPGVVEGSSSSSSSSSSSAFTCEDYTTFSKAENLTS
jgi:hypothetical protein